MKVTNEIDDNILLGKWELDILTCYKTNNPNVFIERYQIKDEPNLDVVIEFIGSEISYTVEDTGCTTSATGFYATEFDGSASGVLDFRRVLSAGTCNVTVPFVGNGAPGANGSIKFALLGTTSTNLDWEMNDNTFTRMKLDFFTSFLGSNDGGYCAEECFCIGTFDKI